MSLPLIPGLITLHGNQLEQLRAAVFDWVASNPLAPLEREIFLVQSNGVAEWLKVALAQEQGVCAATQVMLPARFLWQSYRTMLGPQGVPFRSAFDKAPLTWRLMRMLPSLLKQEGFAPLRYFLADGNGERRLQLAQRLSDLFDQYQVYRADWLDDWAQGREVLRPARGEPIALKPEQRWQALLWQEIIASVPDEQRLQGRADVHLQFVDALHAGQEPAKALPRRVILFGISALPYQTMEALGALSTRMQVIAAVPNPCQYYWGDIVSGRELLTAQRRRQPLRAGKDLASVPMEELHVHSHPLLAGWGRLGRDFIRMLDEFDDQEACAASFSNLRVDLFSEGEGEGLLQQVQAAIRDLLPIQEHEGQALAEDDCSIEFHIAHSAQREVEVLHDRLLTVLAETGQSGQDSDVALCPRDIVIMVPDIATFAPAIRAVFGQHAAHDPRRIPYEIADIHERQTNPLLVALDWLLRLPQQRCLQSEIRDLIGTPALAARFGIAQTDLPRLAQWIAGSGVRWGLDREHRHGLGLGAAGEQNAWIFGVRRMLLGYASGEGAAFAGIEPYAEVGGLDAGLAGSLASLVECLLRWRAILQQSFSPEEWGERARELLQDFFDIRDERDRLTQGKLEQSLQCWLEDCAGADFNEAVPAAVVREAWLGAIDEESLNQRFVSGGVTFCTLMPMRAIPYRMVCLLGMNDGDFPRRAQRADFDLLALPAMARPGDRSRRDDDRYLMLEALLAARDRLYISWVGRNVRDNTALPPSVLVAQLQDYLAVGWELDLKKMTTEHPLQPFSRRYFEEGGLPTYAREWREAYQETEIINGDQMKEKGSAVTDVAFALSPGEAGLRLRLSDLTRFLRQPVNMFFRQRLQVIFDEAEQVSQDDEPFSLDKLEQYQIAEKLLEDEGAQEAPGQAENRLRERAACLHRQGLLPLGLLGQQVQQELVSELLPVRLAWLQLCQHYAQPSDKLRIAMIHQKIPLEDWFDRLRSDGSSLVWLMQHPGRICDEEGAEKALIPRPRALIKAWVRQLAAAAEGYPVTGYLVGRNAVIIMEPLEQVAAREALNELIACWRAGLEQPLPVACRTAIAWLQEKKPEDAYDGSSFSDMPGEVATDPCLHRLWTDFASLSAEKDWELWARRLYAPLVEWSAQHTQALRFEELEHYLSGKQTHSPKQEKVA